jgi:hypothetical protein
LSVGEKEDRPIWQEEDCQAGKRWVKMEKQEKETAAQVSRGPGAYVLSGGCCHPPRMLSHLP